MEEYHLSETLGLNWGDLLEVESIEEAEPVLSGISADELKKTDCAPYDYKKVLLVEDDVTQFGVLEELIVEINPNVIIDWEGSVEGAINRIQTAMSSPLEVKNYDLIISDIFLSDGDSGIDLLKFCNDLNPKMECFLISAYSKEKLKLKALDVPDYIRKPIDFNLFYQKLAPLLSV